MKLRVFPMASVSSQHYLGLAKAMLSTSPSAIGKGQARRGVDELIGGNKSSHKQAVKQRIAS